MEWTNKKGQGDDQKEKKGKEVMIRGMKLKQCGWRGTEWETVALHQSGVNLPSCNAIMVTFAVCPTCTKGWQTSEYERRHSNGSKCRSLPQSMSFFVMTVMHKELQIINCGALIERVRCEAIGWKWTMTLTKKLITKVTLLWESAHGHVGLRPSLCQHRNLLTMVLLMLQCLSWLWS